jgi:uncharacterized protein YkwD
MRITIRKWNVMDRLVTSSLLSVLMIGCLDAPSSKSDEANGLLKQAVVLADISRQGISQPQSVLPIKGMVARSYEERNIGHRVQESERVQRVQPQPLGECKITSRQQEMLRLVNRARARQRDCGGEIFSVAPPLKWNCRLHKAAVVHSQDMIDYDYFDHQGSDGSSVGVRVSRSGYEWRAVGENIAAGYPDNEEVMENLLSSPTHCENIMDPKFREFGSAVISTDQAHYYNYWTQVFAAR